MRTFGLSLLIVLGLVVNGHALTQYIGDLDGFGFGDGSSYFNADGGPTDLNSNGVLDSGDGLPDIDGDGDVGAWSGGGDNFDNRSTSESNDTSGAQWTDVALSSGYTSAPGLARDASFTFVFTVPGSSDPYYGQNHFINLVYGDYDVKPMTAVVEGVEVPLWGYIESGDLDGTIWRTYAPILWADMLDGIVTIDINAPEEPYVAFDYVLLDVRPINPVPEPSTFLLLGAGLAILAFFACRKRKE